MAILSPWKPRIIPVVRWHSDASQLFVILWPIRGSYPSYRFYNSIPDAMQVVVNFA